MICRLIRLVLPLYVGEDLGRRTTRWMSRHLARCLACAEHEQRWRQARVSLHELHATFPIGAPADLVEQVVATLPAKKTLRAEAGPATLIRRWAVAAALVAVPAGVITLALLHGSGVQPIQAPVTNDLATTPAVAPSAPLAAQAPSTSAPAFGQRGSADKRASGGAIDAVSASRNRLKRSTPEANVAVRPRTSTRQVRGMTHTEQHTGTLPGTRRKDTAPARSVPAAVAHGTSSAAVHPSADSVPGQATVGSPGATTVTTTDVTRLLRRLLHEAAGDQDRRPRCPVVESLTYPVGTQVQMDLPESNTTIIWIIPKKES